MKDHYNLITRQQTFRTPSNIIIITRDYVTDYYGNKMLWSECYYTDKRNGYIVTIMNTHLLHICFHIIIIVSDEKTVKV